MIGFIGQHLDQFDIGTPSFRHVILSGAFNRMFDVPKLETVKSEIRLYCRKRRGPLGEANVNLHAKDGSRYEFAFETFYNGYDALTLAVYSRQLPLAWPDRIA